MYKTLCLLLLLAVVHSQAAVQKLQSGSFDLLSNAAVNETASDVSPVEDARSTTIQEKNSDGAVHTQAAVEGFSEEKRKLIDGIFIKPPEAFLNKTGPLPVAPEISLTTETSATKLSVVGEADHSCILESGAMGVCVSFHLCRNHTSVNIDGNTIIIERLASNDIGPCNKQYLQVCCALDESIPPTDIDPSIPKQERPGCGWRNVEGATMRIMGETGGETKFGEFPWMVAVFNITAEDQKIYLGGGSLIHPEVVLTAAHIASKSRVTMIRAGEWDTKTTDEIYPFQERYVDSKVLHEQFNRGNLFYDVALLFLTKPVDLVLHVGLACLPPPRQTAPASARCFATGWGRDKFGLEGEYQNILKKVEVPVVEDNACQTALRTTALDRYFILHSSFMCAGGEKGKDACKGDGGSPLSCPIEGEQDRFMQSGIVAWGMGCGLDGIPGVYVDVAMMRAWIDNKMIGRGYNTSSYTF